MLKSDVVERLKNIVGENSVLTAKEDLAAYAYDGTTTWSHTPDAVVLPATAKQISSILALANENLIPKPAARRTIIAIFDNMTLAGKVVSGPVIERECKDCHAPHGNDYYRLLVRNYSPEFYAPFNISNRDLCFSCHNQDIVLVKETESLTDFRNGTLNLHYLHVNMPERGRTCRSCHATHSSDLPKYLRDKVPYEGWGIPIGFEKTETGGSGTTGAPAYCSLKNLMKPNSETEQKISTASISGKTRLGLAKENLR